MKPASFTTARKRKVLRFIFVAAAALIISALSFKLYSPPTQNTNSSTSTGTDTNPNLAFDPKTIKVGDVIANMKVKDLQYETYGVGSIVATFEGNVTLTGTFEYSTQADPYQPEQIIFTPDERSLRLLPAVTANGTLSKKLLLQSQDAKLLEPYGIPGTTGEATVEITAYIAVYAEILEGVPNRGVLRANNSVNAILPPETQISDQEFIRKLQPLPELPVRGGLPDQNAIFEWLKALSQSYSAGTNPADLFISKSQSDKLKDWLLQVFAPQLTQELHQTLVSEKQQRYWMTGGSLNALPPVEIQQIKDINTEKLPDGGYRYSAVLVLTGTQDAKVECIFTKHDGTWKLERVSYRMGMF